MERQNSIMAARQGLQMAKFPSLGNVNCFLNFTAPEEAGESTDASHTSPSLHPSMESDKGFDVSDSTPMFSEAPSGKPIQLPTITLNPNTTFFQGFKPSDLMVCKRKETSIGHLFESWNFENNNNNETFIFADQKNDKNGQEPTATSILGKRQLENAEGSEFQIPEPSMKRDFSLFLRKGLMSNGTEDGGYFRGDLEGTNIDLMDFSQNLFSWTKAA
jgi:hypothetical protein